MQHKLYTICTTKSIYSEVHQLVFIPVENYISPEFTNFEYVLNADIGLVKVSGQTEQSVSSAWNIGIRKARELGCKYALVINNDIVLKSNAIDKLISFAEKDKKKDIMLWTMKVYDNPEVDWHDYFAVADDLEKNSVEEETIFYNGMDCSSFLVRPSQFINEMGEFDENFKPAYFEDNDMFLRLLKSNKKFGVYNGARFFHYGSRTTNTAEVSFRESHTINHISNHKYFIYKWKNPPADDGGQYCNIVDWVNRCYDHPYNEPDNQVNYWRIVDRQTYKDIDLRFDERKRYCEVKI